MELNDRGRRGWAEQRRRSRAEPRPLYFKLRWGAQQEGGRRRSGDSELGQCGLRVKAAHRSSPLRVGRDMRHGHTSVLDQANCRGTLGTGALGEGIDEPAEP